MLLAFIMFVFDCKESVADKTFECCCESKMVRCNIWQEIVVMKNTNEIVFVIFSYDCEGIRFSCLSRGFQSSFVSVTPTLLEFLSQKNDSKPQLNLSTKDNMFVYILSAKRKS